MPDSLSTAAPRVSGELVRRLACPDCRGALDGGSDRFTCSGCGHVFPIEDGIPDLMPGGRAPRPAAALDASVLVMAYNEEENLARLLPLVREVMDDLGCSYELVVVDGNSRDGTAARASEHGARVHRQTRPGYGNAFREGMALCRGARILTLDADRSHDPGYLRTLWRRRGEADLLVGSRYVAGAEAEMTPFRRYLSLFMNGVFRRVLALDLLDLSSGFRLYDAAAVRSIADSTGRDFDVLVEALVQMVNGGYRVKEIPMYYKPREAGASNLRVARFGVSYGRLLARLWRMRNRADAADFASRAHHSVIPAVRQRCHRRSEAVRAMLDGRAKDLLVVDCGSDQIIQSLPGAVGMDARWQRLRFMRPTHALLVAGRAEAPPFGAASFAAAVWCGDGMVRHADEGLAALHRVLAPGGLLISSARPPFSPRVWMQKLAGHGFEGVASERVAADEYLVLAKRSASP